MFKSNSSYELLLFGFLEWYMFGDNIAAYQTVFTALAISLGFSPASEAADRMIMRAYSDPPSVQNQRLENCCFFDLAPGSG